MTSVRNAPESALPSASLGELLWTPPPERAAGSQIARYRSWLEQHLGLRFDDYAALWTWSTERIEDFWRSLWDFFELGPLRAGSPVVTGQGMPGARWFGEATLNYAERLLSRDDASVALVVCSEVGPSVSVTRADLRERVARAQHGLRRLGVGRGDRVVGFLGNGVEAVVCLLATASLGAIWSSCPPEFGTQSVLDRFAQIEPKVLIAATGYRYGGKLFDKREAVSELRRGLPTLGATVLVPGPAGTTDTLTLESGEIAFSEFERLPGDLAFEPVPFEHPLWILFSSGTTGLPKAIVHGHGGMLLEHLKVLSLHSDIGPSDRFFWFTTTGWMMWNYLVSGLAVGAAIVLYDGNPGYPDLNQLWHLAARERVTYFGASAAYLQACRAGGLTPGATLALDSLRAVGSTGSPLSPDGFAWVYQAVSPSIHLQSVSGGTDLCTAFVAGCPELPVHAGELQCRALGAKVASYDAQGHSVVGSVGELVLEAPMPCMPLCFWKDPDNRRYRESYFEYFPGVWRHGDWLLLTDRGSAVISGRSDATLNRGGVRMGTSEFYRVLDNVAEVRDSLVVDTSHGGVSGELWLFVALREGAVLDQRLSARLSGVLRSQLSPRHVPDRIVAVQDVPRTLSGKKLEVPVKRVLSGTPPEGVVALGTLSNPQAWHDLVQAIAAARDGQARGGQSAPPHASA